MLAGAFTEDAILYCDRTHYIKISNVEDVALPLYEGRMIGQFDFSQKGWVSGKGRTSVWREIDWNSKLIEPQFLMSLENYKLSQFSDIECKVGIMDVTSTTNTRTVISGLIGSYPCGHKVPTLTPRDGLAVSSLEIVSLMNSYTYDYLIRNKLGGQSLIWGVLAETPLSNKLIAMKKVLAQYSSRLCMINNGFARSWLRLHKQLNYSQNWYSLWAITPYERIRLRSILDAIVAELYGLEIEDFAWILKDSDLPKEQINDKTYSRTLDAKGFWRIDKDKDPELRHTVLSQIAFQELKKIGLEAFLNLNNGEGWMIPDTIRLADYGLGHDDRAQTHQPVAERLGARYLDWQLQSKHISSFLEF